MKNPRALLAAEALRSGGQFLKVKGRMLKTFGLLNAIRYRSGLFSLQRMLGFVSRRLGVKIVPLIANDGRLAIDVDDEKSLRMTEEILARDAQQERGDVEV